MHRARLVLAVLALAAIPFPAAAAEDPPKPQVPTLETLQATAQELPEGMRIVLGIHPVQPHAYSFYRGASAPAPEWAPRRRASQSLAAAGRPPGTIFLMEYESGLPAPCRAMLPGLLWGEAPGPTPEEPEEMFESGNFLVLLSFPMGDPAAEWFKKRLTEKFGISTVRRFELGPLKKKLLAAHEANDGDAGLRILAENATAVEGWAYGQYLRGEFCAMEKDFAGAEEAYARALALHDSGKDPLGNFHLWGCLDGLGRAQFTLKRLEPAIATLRRAKAHAEKAKMKAGPTSVTDYFLARALALAEDEPGALAALRDAIAKDASRKAQARTDRDFAAALLRPDFQALLREVLPPAPQASEKDALPVALAALAAPAAELPGDIRAVEGTPAAGPEALPFFQNPGGVEGLPPVKGKASQSLAAEGGRKGTAFLLECAAEVPRTALDGIRERLWGKDAGRSVKRPEEVVVHGRFVVVLSFPRGDRAAEWFKDRLRRRFRIPALQGRTEMDRLFNAVNRACEAHDPDEGLRLLDSCEATVRDWSWGWYYRSEFLLMRKDWPALERAASRALDLHESLEDPLDENLAWACMDSLGIALLNQRKLDACVATLRKALACAAEHGMAEDESVGQTEYNLACALSLSGQWEECLAALRRAIARKASCREMARGDADLAGARERPEFRELLR